MQNDVRCSPLAVDRGVSWHGFGRRVIVRVRAVQEGFPALALGERGVQHQPWTRLRIHGAPAWWGTIFWIEAEKGKSSKHFHEATKRCITLRRNTVQVEDRETWQKLESKILQTPRYCGVGRLPPGYPENYALLTNVIFEQVVLNGVKWDASTQLLSGQNVYNKTWITEILIWILIYIAPKG